MSMYDELKKLAFLAADIKDAGCIATVGRLAASAHIKNEIALEQLLAILDVLAGAAHE